MRLKKYLFLLSLGASAFLQADACFPESCCYPYAVTPPTFSGGCGWDFELSLLYLKADAVNSNWAENFNFVDGRAVYEGYRLPYAWDYGFSIGVGSNLPCDFWSVKASWMHFENQVEESLRGVFNDGGSIVYPVDLYFVPSSGTNQTALDGNFTLQINRLDLALSRESLLGPHLTFSPFFGLRALFLRNKESWEYEIESISRGISDISHFNSNFSNNVRTLGIFGGMEACYEWKCGLEFVGSFSAALLYGHQKTSLELDSDVLKDYSGWNLEGSHWGLLPETDLFLGFAWRGDGLISSCSNLRVSVGWENQLYFKGYNRAGWNVGNEPPYSKTNFRNPLLSLTGIRLAIEAQF